MNAMRLLAVTVVVCAAGVGVRAEDKPDNAKRLVGKWEVTKADEGTLPVGAVVEFTKDGKLKATRSKDGQEDTREGTYTVEKDKLTVVLKRGDEDRKQVITIKKISDKELSIEGDDGKSLELKKK